jgi:LmbE family N-acetylglucosaminyl deacetylase
VFVKIVVLSPHRDDAAVSVGLAIDAWIAAGHKVSIVNACTRSEHAPFADMHSVHANDRTSFVSALRHREDEAWRRRVGNALTLVDLNVKDAPLRLHCSPLDVTTIPLNPNDKAIAKVQKAIEQIKPGALLIPLALGNDADHRAVREAAAALTATDLPCCFYEELPDAAAIESIDAAVSDLARTLNTDLAPVFASATGDVEAAVTRKFRIAVGYDSQINDATAADIAEFSRRYDGRERLWANAAWQASALAINA